MEQATQNLLIACEECGVVVDLPAIQAGEKALCPRCGHTLTETIEHPFQRVIAYASTCLIMLVLSISFPFMSFSVQGLSQQITMLQAATMLDEYQNSALAGLLLLTVIVLPAIYIGSLLYLYIRAAAQRQRPLTEPELEHIKVLGRAIFRVEPWLMVDVFLIGVLVSLVKIAAMADIGMGSSFWAFCLYTLLVVKCISLVDKNWLWSQFIPTVTVPGISAGATHHNSNVLDCHLCHQLNPRPQDGKAQRCLRCGSFLHPHEPDRNLQHSWALLLSAAIFYLPANLYPIMYTVSLGSNTPSTILGGVVLLWHHGSYPIAMIIFLASVLIPLAKMFALAWLFIAARRSRNTPPEMSLQRQKLYRMTEFIGRWSMIDIFVVAILVALVQLQNLMAIYPGPAALSFAIVVIFTMLSAMRFDSRTLWPDHIKRTE